MAKAEICAHVRRGKCMMRGGNDVVRNPATCRCSRYEVKQKPIKRGQYANRTRKV